MIALVPLLAHGISGREDLPIPDWLFGWAAVVVLVASFVALAVLWPRPRLERDAFRPLPAGLGRALTHPAVEVLGGAFGVGLLGVVVWSGLFGAQGATANFTPTFVYVVFWLGLVPVSVLLGDVFAVLSPWRAIGRLVGWAAGGRAPEVLPYPERLGRWPAAVGLFAFAWLELASAQGDRPSRVAVAALVYTAVTLVGMTLYGTEPWIRRAEAFSVYFGLLARIAPFERRGRTIGLRPPLSGLPRVDSAPGTVAVLAVMIGTVSFDGLSAGSAFGVLAADGVRVLRDAGLGPSQALELTFGLSMLVVTILVAALYVLGVAGAARVTGDGTRHLATGFAHTLVPIALAYAAAHYVSLLLLQGQGIAALASDPLGDGGDLLGTADWAIDYGLLGATTFWYLQVAFVVAGHVAALALAHDRALVLARDPRDAARSQLPLLATMVAFTSLALWLLSAAAQG